MVLEGPCTRGGGREGGATGAFERGVAATPLLHTQNCGMSRDRGLATPWSATGGGCSVCPTKFLWGKVPRKIRFGANFLAKFGAKYLAKFSGFFFLGHPEQTKTSGKTLQPKSTTPLRSKTGKGIPGFGTHANTQNLPHSRASPASLQEHSPPKCLFFMANAKLPNRPVFALLPVGPCQQVHSSKWAFRELRIERGGGHFLLGNRDGVGEGFQGGEAGWRTPRLGGCRGEGGGLNIFFRGRNVHQD